MILYLCIKSPFVIGCPSSILCYNNKIGCRSILRSRITPFSAQFIGCMVISVMIGIDNKPSSVFPDSIPTSICYSSMEYSTSFVNADIIWTWFCSWIYTLQKLQNICWRLRLRKFCPCNYSTTWSTYCFNAVKSRRSKIMTPLWLWSKFIMRLWITFRCWIPRQIFTRSP